ncbi:MAG: outer membrane protein assembly factor BamD [Deltaproteobacteria bacterium]|nr:outer membrane protein assembly factor BamD [Deltaproteobacteria bacterium]
MRVAIATLVLAIGCGSAAPKAGPLPAARCAQDSYFDGQTCRKRDSATAAIDAGAKALAAFEIETAVDHLQRAKTQGPLPLDQLKRVHEQLGIAYAYLGKESEALAEFDALLALAPGHLLPYTLSPKATFIFEKARKRARQRARASIDVNWPRKLEVEDEVPLEVEVIADPKKFLARAVVHVRKAGSKDYGQVPVDLSKSKGRVVLPPVAGTKPETLQVFVTAFDPKGNEVLRWSSASRPRDIPLSYQPPAPWFKKWWVWAIAGGVVAASTGAVVFALESEPPDTIGASADIR